MMSTMKTMLMIFLFLFPIQIASHISASPPVVVRLTHHHSRFHPNYNKSESLLDRAMFDFRTSVNRAALLSHHYKSSSISPRQNQPGFLVHLRIGSENIDQYVIMDTLNSFFWINCQPTNPFVTPPVYDPTTSSSYRPQDCTDTDACLVPDAVVDLDCSYDPTTESCSFEIDYADHVYTSGDLAIEDLMFDKSVGKLVLENVTFGCSHDSNLYGANGVIGLGKSSFSVVTQQRFRTFSYCIGNVSDPEYRHHKLILADTFYVLGNVTPIINSVLSDNFCYINLEEIYFNDYRIHIDPTILRRNTNLSTGGMVLDVSSTYTFLPQVVYDRMAILVDFELDNFVTNDSLTYNGKSRLCYKGIITRDLLSFSKVKLGFQGGAIMELGTENLFHQVSEDSFCFAVLPIEYFHPGSTVSIMGIIMQQNFYLGFDLALQQFASRRVDCSFIG